MCDSEPCLFSGIEILCAMRAFCSELSFGAEQSEETILISTPALAPKSLSNPGPPLGSFWFNGDVLYKLIALN